MGGVDHDGLAELAANRARRSLRWISRAQNIANFPNCFDAFISKRDALFRTWFVEFAQRTFGGSAPRHKANNVFKLVIPENRAKNLAKLLFVIGAKFEPEFLFDSCTGLRANHVLKFSAEGFPNRTIKINRL